MDRPSFYHRRVSSGPFRCGDPALFFLVTVSDRNGISFYHDDKICTLIKIGLTSLGEARDGLINKSLLAYEYPIYQVLSLPPEPVTPLTREEILQQQSEMTSQHMKRIREALQ